MYGGRWNPRGRRAVYGALDPSTAILEVAVHRGFAVLDAMPHTLTRTHLTDPTRLRVLAPNDVPEPAWLRPGIVSEAQQQFGAGLLDDQGAFLLPSAVSSPSWNVVLDPNVLAEITGEVLQESFVLDPRLHKSPWTPALTQPVRADPGREAARPHRSNT